MTLRRGISKGVFTALWLTASAASAQTPEPEASAKPLIMMPNTTETAQYDPATGFPERNGPLSGMLIIIPQQEVDQFNQPTGSERSLNRVARAESGALLAIKLVFLGVESDWDNNVDVTYDLSITAPDGKAYGEAYLNLSAAKGKMARNAGVYDNRNKVVLMQFEPQDVPGVYTVRAVLRDRIGGRELPLTTQVELLARQPDPLPGTSPAVEGAATAAAPDLTAPVPDPQPKAKPKSGKKKYLKRRR